MRSEDTPYSQKQVFLNFHGSSRNNRGDCGIYSTGTWRKNHELSQNKHYCQVNCHFCGKWGHKQRYCKKRIFQEKKLHNLQIIVPDKDRINKDSTYGTTLHTSQTAGKSRKMDLFGRDRDKSTGSRLNNR